MATSFQPPEKPAGKTLDKPGGTTHHRREYTLPAGEGEDGKSMGQKLWEAQAFEGLRHQDETFTDLSFVDCEFTDCALEACKLVRCTFTGCKFTRCRASELKAEDSQLKYGEFFHCAVTGLDWGQIKPRGRFSEPISQLEDCRLKYNTFPEMSLQKFDFSGNELAGCLFAECALAESSFHECLLTDTEFFQCDLRRADFRGASGYSIDISANTLKGARFSYPEVVRLLDSLELQID